MKQLLTPVFFFQWCSCNGFQRIIPSVSVIFVVLTILVVHDGPMNDPGGLVFWTSHTHDPTWRLFRLACFFRGSQTMELAKATSNEWTLRNTAHAVGAGARVLRMSASIGKGQASNPSVSWFAELNAPMHPESWALIKHNVFAGSSNQWLGRQCEGH